MGKTQKIVGLALIVLALILAGYAWVLSERMTARQHEDQPQLQPVVVAATKIPAGSIIAPEMVRQAMFPARPDGAYADSKAVVGKTTASDLAAGEPLIQERLEVGQRILLQHLQAGERAVAVRVDDVVAVGNRLTPGDFVDVYVTLRRNNEEIPDTQSRLLLEKLKVLAFGSKDPATTKADNSAGGTRSTSEVPKNAVLAVKLDDVDKLALAAESGRLLLALRPSEQAAAAGDVSTVARTEDSAKALADAATPARLLPAAITLRQLVASPRAADRARPPGIAAPPAGLRIGTPPGQAVTVMHGLKEKTIYVGTKKNEARP